MTAALLDFQGAHSGSDILIHVPEEKMLLVGDVFGHGWLPEYQGTGEKGFVWWIKRIQEILDGPHPPLFILPSHEEMMTPEELRTWVSYLDQLWREVSLYRKKDFSLDQILADLALEAAFPQFVKNAEKDEGRSDRHKNNIRTFWRILSEKNI
jgi:glyoxylase-like metal-dependent hydrolase (beta-lactamase superfamily II)